MNENKRNQGREFDTDSNSQELNVLRLNLDKVTAIATDLRDRIDRLDNNKISSDSREVTAQNIKWGVKHDEVNARLIPIIDKSGDFDGHATTVEGALQHLSDIDVDGTGTANTVAKWTDVDTIGDSSITDDGATVTITPAVVLSSTLVAPNIGTGEDNSVVVLDSDGGLKTDEIDPRVWGTDLVGGSGTATYIPKWTDGDTLEDSAFQEILVSAKQKLAFGGTPYDNTTYPDVSIFRSEGNKVDNSYFNTTLLALESLNGVAFALKTGANGNTRIDFWIGDTQKAFIDYSDGNDRLSIDAAGNGVSIEINDQQRTGDVTIGSSVSKTSIKVDGATGYVSTASRLGVGKDAALASLDINSDLAIGSIVDDGDSSTTVLVDDGTGLIKSNQIDARVWGTDLADLTNGVNNRVVTSLDADSLNGESNLTFNGATLGVTGDVTMSGGIKIGEGVIKNTTRIDSTDSPYDILETDNIIFADTDGGAITCNLPLGVNGTEYIMKNAGSSGNLVTLVPNGAETIDGTLISDGECFQAIFEDTEKWRVI